MKVLRCTILLLALAVFFSCKKKTYPPEHTVENDPVFSFSARIDGVEENLKAGIDGYYNFSSHGQATINNLYYFIADLRKGDCAGNCAKSLQIRINDYTVMPTGANININNSLSPHFYPVQAGSNSYSVAFQSVYNRTAATYLWDFGDGLTSTEANPSHFYSRPGKYKVSLKIVSTNGCVSTIANTQKIFMGANTLTATVYGDSTVANYVHFIAVTNGSPSILWNFGDGNTSTQAIVTHTYAYTGGYPVIMRAISGTDTAIVNYNAVTQNDNSSCAANYRVASEVNVGNMPTPSNVVITWVDENGMSWTSENVAQPTDSYFQIVSAEDYSDNEKNERTKKLNVRFKCTVFNGTNSKKISNASATICVSYH